ncbi:MAG: hypothetical protein JSW55_11425 [Chloroflexota bacterium]|nr:MAG: hypothetical protein JSW55_11425 [Chloroflexota bacterium]
MLLVFAVCLIPVHIWLIVTFLGQARGIAMRLTTWDFVGAVAYVLSFALLESVLLFLAIMVLAFILPGRMFRSKFVALSTVLVLVASAWFIYLHFNDEMIDNRQITLLALWVFSFALALVGLSLLVHRSQRIENSLFALAGRLAVLAILYIFIDLLSVIVVVLRNV